MTIQKKTRADLLSALRSGEFKQAKGVLRDAESGGMCCLGVGASIAGTFDTDLNGRTLMTISGLDTFGLDDKLEPSSLTFTQLQVEGYGITNDQAYSLAVLNDTSGVTFEDIADIIENDIVPKGDRDFGERLKRVITARDDRQKVEFQKAVTAAVKEAINEERAKLRSVLNVNNLD